MKFTPLLEEALQKPNSFESAQNTIFSFIKNIAASFFINKKSNKALNTLFEIAEKINIKEETKENPSASAFVGQKEDKYIYQNYEQEINTDEFLLILDSVKKAIEITKESSNFEKQEKIVICVIEKILNKANFSNIIVSNANSKIDLFSLLFKKIKEELTVKAVFEELDVGNRDILLDTLTETEKAELLKYVLKNSSKFQETEHNIAIKFLSRVGEYISILNVLPRFKDTDSIEVINNTVKKQYPSNKLLFVLQPNLYGRKSLFFPDLKVIFPQNNSDDKIEETIAFLRNRLKVEKEIKDFIFIECKSGSSQPKIPVNDLLGTIALFKKEELVKLQEILNSFLKDSTEEENIKPNNLYFFAIDPDKTKTFKLDYSSPFFMEKSDNYGEKYVCHLISENKKQSIMLYKK